MLQSTEAFQSVVLGGARQHNGMASFTSVLTGDDVDAIRAFVILRANQDKPAATAAPAPPAAK
jgi:alpha-galactosidase